MPEVVYLIGSAGGSVFKIGRTANIEHRLRQLQPGHPAKLEVLWTTPGSALIEGELHRWFDGCRLFGEWFDFGTLDPVEAVNAATEEIRAWWATRTGREVPAEVNDPLRESALAGLRNAKHLRGEDGNSKKDVAEAADRAITSALQAKIGVAEIARTVGVSDSHVRALRRKHNIPADPRYAHLKTPTATKEG